MGVGESTGGRKKSHPLRETLNHHTLGDQPRGKRNVSDIRWCRLHHAEKKKKNTKRETSIETAFKRKGCACAHTKSFSPRKAKKNLKKEASPCQPKVKLLGPTEGVHQMEEGPRKRGVQNMSFDGSLLGWGKRVSFH